jgi:hypothetical protein
VKFNRSRVKGVKTRSMDIASNFPSTVPFNRNEVLTRELGSSYVGY